MSMTMNMTMEGFKRAKLAHSGIPFWKRRHPNTRRFIPQRVRLQPQK